MIGRIKNLVSEKRFGFIECQGTEYFFHRDDLIGFWDDLVEDFQKKRLSIQVEFEIGHSNKGPRAANVKRLDHPNQTV